MEEQEKVREARSRLYGGGKGLRKHCNAVAGQVIVYYEVGVALLIGMMLLPDGNNACPHSTNPFLQCFQRFQSRFYESHI